MSGPRNRQRLRQAEPAGSEETQDKHEQTSSEQAKNSEEPPVMDTPLAAEYEAMDDRDIPVIEVERQEEKYSEEDRSPLSTAINDLFEQIPPVDKMAEKVNASLDEMGENLRKFSGEINKGLDQIAEQLMSDSRKKD